MSNANEERIRELLRKAMPPITTAEPRRDLWPEVLRKLDQHRQRALWWDWALFALLALWLLFSREDVPVLLYHL